MENNNLRSLFQMVVRRFGFLNEQCCENCCGEEISLLQSHILYEIKRQNDPSMQEVAGALGIDITTFSRQIKTLVDREIVKKTPHPNDNRVNILSLTEKGETMEINIDQEMNHYLSQILSHLSEYERESVIRSVKLLNDAMKKSESYCCPPK
ncbi:MarR family winged helix-turn-helix transcriptional regulator [Fredinandcohnia salidurans]|uniref:MarR family winged helix-turn-helix transcriptional regulator n=1 Tax=Fredinandcohnia salidurans TaxID=2595041 RepID=A0ABW4MPI9_9BACI|nr:MarR family winged helix-turn-helix transcriptional regulator [Fredinandcohnia onubensis]